MKICLEDEHKWVWAHRWTLVCEYCNLHCEMDDGYPGEPWHPDLTDDKLAEILQENYKVQEKKESDARSIAKVEEFTDNAVM